MNSVHHRKKDLRKKLTTGYNIARKHLQKIVSKNEEISETRDQLRLGFDKFHEITAIHDNVLSRKRLYPIKALEEVRKFFQLRSGDLTIE